MDSLGFGLEGPDASVRRRRGDEARSKGDATTSLELVAIPTARLARAERTMAVLNIAIA